MPNFTPVTPESQPTLANDQRNWTQLGQGEYYQSDPVDGITLEIRHHENGKYRWWVYDDKSPDPETAVIQDDEDTLDKALAAAIDFLPSLR
jgi:hypothetical protein